MLHKSYTQHAEFSDALTDLQRIARELGVKLEHTEDGWKFARQWDHVTDERVSRFNQEFSDLKSGYRNGTLNTDYDRAAGKLDGIYG